jgi:hypothetical protein
VSQAHPSDIAGNLSRRGIRACPVPSESGHALIFLSGACSYRKTGVHFSGTCASRDPLPHAGHDDRADGGQCPACNAAAPIAPAASEYRGEGLIHHHWRCRACGHRWTTALHVPA